MAIHAVVNEAGSAGKTTTAVTLAAILAESGRRTRCGTTTHRAMPPCLLGFKLPKVRLRPRCWWGNVRSRR